MKIFAALFLLSLSLHASEEKQFPNPNQVYIPGKDVGFNQYLTKTMKGTRKVALTFDDGPHLTNTPRLLDILQKYKVKATFFILTERINPNTLPIIYRMMAEGHTISSHHLNHYSADTKTEAVYRSELSQSITSIASLMAEQNALRKEIYYRFPYGAYGGKKTGYHHMNVMKSVSKTLFADNCINFVFWDIDTVDWLKLMTPADIAQNVIAHVFGGTSYDFKENSDGSYSKITVPLNDPPGGGVVLLHDIHTRSVDATEILLQRLAERKVKVVELQTIEEYDFKGKECRLKI